MLCAAGAAGFSCWLRALGRLRMKIWLSCPGYLYSSYIYSTTTTY